MAWSPSLALPGPGCSRLSGSEGTAAGPGARIAQVSDVTDSANPTEVTCGGYSNRYSAFRRESCVFTASESGAYRITVHGNISSSRQDYSTGPYKLTVTAR